MKKILTSFAIVVAGLAFSQVGVNNDNPEATLDIKVKDASDVATDVEGVLVPRVTANRAKSMGEGVPESTLVYIESGNALAGTTISEVDGKGFYYFDAAKKKWFRVGSASNIATTRSKIQTLTTPVAATQINDDTFTVIVEGTAETNLELPNPSGVNNGRVLAVCNQGGAPLTFTGSYQPARQNGIESGAGFFLISNGSEWFLIGGLGT